MAANTDNYKIRGGAEQVDEANTNISHLSPASTADSLSGCLSGGLRAISLLL